MRYALFFLCRIVSAFLTVQLLAMLLRVILSWSGTEEDGPLMGLLLMLTEPVVGVVRGLLSLFGVDPEGPIDVGFFVAAMMLSGLRMFLPNVAAP